MDIPLEIPTISPTRTFSLHLFSILVRSTLAHQFSKAGETPDLGPGVGRTRLANVFTQDSRIAREVAGISGFGSGVEAGVFAL